MHIFVSENNLGELCLVRDEQKQDARNIKKWGASGIKSLKEYSKREIALLDIILWHVTWTFKILIKVMKMNYFFFKKSNTDLGNRNQNKFTLGSNLMQEYKSSHFDKHGYKPLSIL